MSILLSDAVCRVSVGGDGHVDLTIGNISIALKS